jgi:hypothetical protein
MGGMRKLAAAASLIVALPVAAQLPPAPTPVPGSLLDDGSASGDAKPRTERLAKRAKAKALPEERPWKTERPDWLRVDPTVIATADGSNLKKRKGLILRDGIATHSMQHPDLTWFTRVFRIPPQEQACATIYLKLHDDFEPGDGGKLPGFANTGMGRRYSSKPEVINGRKYPNTAWGGRKPDGIHWSARSGFSGWDADSAKLRTYFYAMKPRNLWGWVNTVGELPKGRWSAYVQCVKLNTPGTGERIPTPTKKDPDRMGFAPGRDDGGLYYEIAGTDYRYARDDIRWRDLDAPEALIDELWLNFYCGGTECGKGPRGTISFAKAVVTKGLPDMKKVQAEVARLDRAAP